MKKIAVIKFGGHAFANKESVNTLVSNIQKLQKENYSIVIAHGGTPEIKERLLEKNIASEMVDGFRVTTDEIMDIAQEVILGKTAVNIVKQLCKNGIASIALNGTDCNLLKCKKLTHKNNVDYQHSGEIVNVNTSLLRVMMDNNIIPVVSPVGVDDIGNSYNLNSDFLASKIAIALNADILYMVTNINGIRMNLEDDSSRISILDNEKKEELLNSGIIKPAMETKVNACFDFVNTGKVAYIMKEDQEINSELYKGIKGTKLLSKIEDVEIRLATKDDADDIIAIMQDSFGQYQENIEYKIAPLLETKEDVLKEIENKFVFVGCKDNKVVSSIRLDIKERQGRASRMCVYKEYQHYGIGSKLIKHAEIYAANKGALILGLTTLHNAEYLDKFYEKNGWTNRILNDSRGYTRALLWKQLDPNLNIDFNWYIL